MDLLPFQPPAPSPVEAADLARQMICPRCRRDDADAIWGTPLRCDQCHGLEDAGYTDDPRFPRALVASFYNQFRFVVKDSPHSSEPQMNDDQKIGYLVACCAVDLSTPSGWTTAMRVAFARQVLAYGRAYTESGMNLADGERLGLL